MRIILLLLIVGFCLVSAKYLPSETRDYNVLSRMKRSDDSDDSSSSIEHDKKLSESNTNSDDDDNDDTEDDDILDNQEKEQQDIIKRKAVVRQEKEKHKQEEQQKKMEEKRAKEQRKEQEKREKEERKRLEKLEKEKRKEEEKRLKEEKKKQDKEQKQIQQLEKESFDKFEGDDFLGTEEESSIELADVWRNHIYVKYGLTLASTKIEKQAALKRYLQEELGLRPNSTESERRQAIVQLIQTKLQADTAERTALKNQLISHINAVSIQKLRTKLEKDLEDLNNKTQILSNVSLPWVSEARQNVEDKKSFVETITQFLSSILPNWVIGGQTVQNSISEEPVISNGPPDPTAENSINATSESSIAQSSNDNSAHTEINAPSPIADKDPDSQSSVLIGGSEITSNNANDNAMNSSVVGSHDSYGATTGNEVVLATGPVSVGNSLVPPGENNGASVNDDNTLLTSVNSESSTADSNIVSSNSGISVSANSSTEQSSTGEPSTTIKNNVPSINISEDTVKIDNSGSISTDGSVSFNVVDKISSTSISADSPIGINSRPGGATPNEVDTANNSEPSPGETLSSQSTEGSLDVSIDKIVPDETLITKPDSVFSNSIGVSSSSVVINESPATSNIASANQNNNPNSNVADTVVLSNVNPSAANVGTSEDGVIYNGRDEIISDGSTSISPESNNFVPTIANVVSFEGDKAVSSNSVDSASTSITNNVPGTGLDITTSPNVVSLEGNQVVSGNSVQSESSSINNASDPRLDTALADGREGSPNFGSISVTESSFAIGSSIASDSAASKIDLIFADTAAKNTTLITVELNTEGNEINSNVIPSASSSAKDYNEIGYPSGSTVPVHEAGSTGDVFSVNINDVTLVTSSVSTESNVNENHNATIVNTNGVTSADEHAISEGSTNLNEISIQTLDTSSNVKDTETTISPEFNPAKPDGEISVQPLSIATENPSDSGLANEVLTTVSNTISNVNTVSASVEPYTPSERPLAQTSESLLDNTIPFSKLTTSSLSDGITLPVEEGASVVEILQQ